MSMKTATTNKRLRTLGATLTAGVLVALTLGCHSGTPAAPEGTELVISFEYIPGSRNRSTGDFEALVRVTAIDAVTNVPQVGIGIFYTVDSGPGNWAGGNTLDRVTSDGGGKTVNTLVATGALDGNPVIVSAFSGEAMSEELTLDVEGGVRSDDSPPTARMDVPDVSGRTVDIDVSDSEDEDCVDEEPDTWSVDWGDGSEIERNIPFSDPEASHTYSDAGTYTIKITVVDCQNLDDSTTRTVTVS